MTPGPNPPLRDEPSAAPVSASAVLWSGPIFAVRRDTFELGAAGVLTRDVVAKAGAVAVVALDDEERVVLIQQYRHAVGAREWEVPAGLLDVPGERLVEAAARELAEETDLRAGRWDVLLDHLSSPGFTDERIVTFLARDLTDVPADERHTRDGEELGMPVRRVPLDEAVAAVLGGSVRNVTTVAAVLAADAARSRGWSGLRPASSV